MCVHFQILIYRLVAYLCAGRRGRRPLRFCTDIIGVAAKSYKKFFGVRGSPKRAGAVFGVHGDFFSKK